MIHNRFKKVLLVAPEILTPQLTADYKNVRHINCISQIFPSIYESTPNLIVLDHSYVSKDMEKIVRRIRANSFYSKIKICCYKSKIEPKADSLLKAIGVDYFIYQEELATTPKSKNTTNIFNAIFDISILGLVPNT